MDYGVGYQQAVGQYLQQVLQTLVNSNGVPAQIANHIANVRPQWESQFIGSLPQQGEVDENVFINQLGVFLLNQAQMLANQSNSQHGFGTNQPNGFGQPNRGFGQPTSGFGQPNRGFGQPSSGFGAPSAGFGAPTAGFGAPSATPAMGSTLAADVYGVENNSTPEATAPTAAPVIIPHPVIHGMPEKFQPEWVQDTSLVKQSSGSYGHVEYLEYEYPANDHEKRLRVLTLTTTNASLGDPQHIAALLRRHWCCSDDLVARVSHKTMNMVEGCSTADAKVALESIKAICGKASTTPLEKLTEIIKTLDTEFSHGVYKAFERIIIDIFNNVLKGKGLVADQTSHISVSIDSMTNIKMFSPAARNSSVEPLTSDPRYAKAYDEVISLIIDKLSSCEVGSSMESVLYAARTVPGIDGFKWSMIFEEALIDGDGAAFQDFFESSCVIGVEETIYFVDMEIHKGSNIDTALHSKAGYALLTEKSGNYDNIIGRVCNESGAHKVYGVDTGECELLLSHTLDLTTSMVAV